MSSKKKPPVADTILHEMVRDSPSLSDSTKQTYLSDINAWVAFAGTDPKKWTRHEAQRFYTHLRGRMQTQSANRVMATLAYAAGWWATKENKPELDFSVIQKAKPEDIEDREALTANQSQSLLEVIVRHQKKDPQRVTRDLAMVIVDFETGMRRAGLASMRLETTGYVDTTLATNVKLKGEPKPYTVALSETADRALKPWGRFLEDSKITKGPVWRSLRQQGRKLIIGSGFTSQAIYNLVTQYAEEAKLPRLTPHIIRHTFISWRLAAGWTPQQIAAITGHQLPRTLGVVHGDIGAMHGYVTPSVFWPKVSSGTPEWLKAFVAEHCR